MEGRRMNARYTRFMRYEPKNDLCYCVETKEKLKSQDIDLPRY